MSPTEVASFLAGCVVGVLGVLVLTGLAMYFVDLRSAWREGDQTLDGAEFERNRRREHE